MRKSIRFISVGILSLGMSVALVGCDGGEDYNAPKEETEVTQVDETEVVEEVAEEKHSKEDIELAYKIGVQSLLETVRDSQDEVMRLFDGSYELSQEQWLVEVGELGRKIEIAYMTTELFEVPQKHAVSDAMLKDAIYELKYFSKNAKDMQNYIDNAGSVETLVKGLSTGISKLTQSLTYRNNNESN